MSDRLRRSTIVKETMAGLKDVLTPLTESLSNALDRPLRQEHIERCVGS